MAERRGIPPPKKDRKEYNEAQELESLQRVFDRLDKKADKKIDAEELFEYLKFLGHKCKKAEVEDMIWEVDEDCDRCVAWDEFKTMYACQNNLRHSRQLAVRIFARFYRVRSDKSGFEPRRLFNVVEFMMHDKDCSGTIDMDECMEILFRRFGKELLESKVKEFMSKDEDGDNDITFTEFLQMDRKNDQSQISRHPGFRLSQGVMETTRSENQRIMAAMNGSTR